MKNLFFLCMGVAILTVFACNKKVDVTAENKAKIQRVFDEIYNHGNLNVADEIYSPEYVWHNVSGPDVHGNEGMKQHVAMVRNAFPDIHIIAEDMVAEGDMVATRWTIFATHKGEFGGIPPTGAKVTFTGILFSRFVNGKIVEDWENSDVLGLMQQLGVVPPMPDAPLPALNRKSEDFLWGEPSVVTGAVGDAEKLKAIVHRELEQIWNQGEVARLDEFYAANFVNHDPTWPDVRDFESYKQWTATTGRPPNLHLTIDNVIVEEDRAAYRWSATFKDPASGSDLSLTGTMIVRFADEKIVELWWSKDFMGLVQQLGIIPKPEATEK